MKNFTKLFALAVVILGFSATSFGQDGTATATGTVDAGVSINHSGTDLDFGTFIPGAGIGTIEVTPGGVTTPTGVTKVAAGTAAIFTVTGTPEHTYGINLPASGYLLKRNGGTETISVGTWTSTPTSSGSFGLGVTTQTLSIGATLTVGTIAANPAGVYTNATPFEVTVIYQ